MEEKDTKTIVIREEEEIIEEIVYDFPPTEGKVWRRKIDGLTFCQIEKLGMLFFVNGKRLDQPIVETADDYELVDITEDQV
ncbi:hypothetical protein [Dysgonomonas sp. ZJ279]|uniref:hypothetical protein n=1 Tax=Dysgonomonas sp. ZJ279 TaxID=2709796 RepID=UPI0013ED8CA2|nr:hypothetical protein [Dysgonomonas sp. ZJ279]